MNILNNPQMASSLQNSMILAWIQQKRLSQKNKISVKNAKMKKKKLITSYEALCCSFRRAAPFVEHLRN